MPDAFHLVEGKYVAATDLSHLRQVCRDTYALFLKTDGGSGVRPPSLGVVVLYLRTALQQLRDGLETSTTAARLFRMYIIQYACARAPA